MTHLPNNPVERLAQQLLALLVHDRDPWHLVVARFILLREAALNTETERLQKVAKAAKAYADYMAGPVYEATTAAEANTARVSKVKRNLLDNIYG